MASTLLPPAHSILLNLGGLIALFPTVLGALFVARPASAVSGWNFKVASDVQSRKLAHDQFRIFGIREVFLGTSLLATWWVGDGKLMGILLMMTCAVAFVDGVVQRNQTGKGGEWKHWAFLPPVAGVAAGLLGWFDGLW